MKLLLPLLLCLFGLFIFFLVWVIKWNVVGGQYLLVVGVIDLIPIIVLFIHAGIRIVSLKRIQKFCHPKSIVGQMQGMRRKHTYYLSFL